MISGVKRFFRQSWFSFKALFGWLDPKIYLMVKVINPIFTVLFFCLMVKFAYNATDVTPYLIGNSIVLCSVNGVFGVGFILTMERFTGTLKLVTVAPMNKFEIFVGRGFFHIIDGFVTVLIGLLAGYLFFSVNFHGSFLELLLVLIVTSFSVFGFGTIIGSLGLVITDINLILNVASMVLLGFTGANFPIYKLPELVQKFSNVLPLTRGIEGARMIAEGARLNQVGGLIMEEFLLGVIFIFIGYLIMNFTEHLALKKGNLDLY